MEIIFKMQCKCNVCSLQRTLEVTLLEAVDFSSEALEDAVGYKTLGAGGSSSFQMSEFTSSSFGGEMMQGACAPLGSPETGSLSTLQHFSSYACDSAFTFQCHWTIIRASSLCAHCPVRRLAQQAGAQVTLAKRRVYVTCREGCRVI